MGFNMRFGDVQCLSTMPTSPVVVGNAHSGQFGQATNTLPARIRSDQREIYLLIN